MELCAGGSVVWLGRKGSFSFLYGVRLCGNQFRDADQVVGDEVQQESSGDTSNPAMLSLAHRAMLLALQCVPDAAMRPALKNHVKADTEDAPTEKACAAEHDRL